MMRTDKWIRILGLMIIGLVWAGSSPAQPVADAEEYRLGFGDVLQLNVLQAADLDRELTIQQDGTAFIPLVGEISLAGLTIIEAEQEIQRHLELFNPNIDAVTLSMVEFNALRIYILGAVASPGPYTFTRAPSLWDAMRTAGGPLESANLNSVRLVRQQTTGVMSQTVNLSSLMTGGTEIPSVQLLGGDTLIVPTRSESVAQIAPTEGVQIFGAVATPTTVPLATPTRLLTCLMMAGSPLENAKLDKIWLVHRSGEEQFNSTLVNLKEFVEKGRLSGNPLVYPGDTINVTVNTPGWLRRTLPLFLTTLATTGTIYLIYDRIQENNP